MKPSLKGLSLWQILRLAIKDGLKEGHSLCRDEAAYARQLRADELRNLQAARARRSRRQG